MKFSASLFYLFAALIAVIPAPVAAGDNGGGDNGGDNSQWKPQPPSSHPPDRDHPERPEHPDRDQWCDKKKPDDDDKGRDDDKDKKKVQVLWGQCGGYYYYGTKNCPEGSYCRYFSDWYSQCNPNNN